MRKNHAIHLICRSCAAALKTLFADLGMTPISNAFRTAAMLSEPEPFYPLRAYVCDRCKLVQLQDFQAPETHFHDQYAYLSSFSDTWLAHARDYAETAVERFKLDSQSFAVEVASNDGYLLQYFLARGIPCLGIDPAANCARVAREKHGVETRVAFFNRETAGSLAKEGRVADLIIANNVLAHVPDLNEFVAAFPILLKPQGVVTFEFPHLLNLMRHNQFDTIYHEHYSYLSYLALVPLFARHGLRVFDAERLSTHGGSLRLFVSRDRAGHARTDRVAELEAEERQEGLDTIAAHTAFGAQVARTKRELVSLLISLKNKGATIAAYGAPAKGNTLLNYCGVRTDILDFTVDRNPIKQNTYLPGTLIPVLSPEAIAERRPRYVLILPWNIQDEIIRKNAFIRDWGGKFIVPIPKPMVLD
jgi:2-polyprenyl-3-methyl-5-hydroxy-6-metoxy-1,4-benzoquinol methylase